MNSILQQLYMIPSFRKGILEVGPKEESSNNDAINVLYCMKLLFGNLRDSKRGCYDASVLCKYIKDFDGRALSIYEQRDADEFFALLMDRIEFNLKNTNRPELIKDILGGSFSNDVICEGCPHRSTVKEEFLALNLQIHNKKSIAEGLNSFIEPENLSNSNAYHCDKCNKKVNAKKRVSFGVLPNVFIIALKRFEFDFQRNAKVKLNDYFEFPMELNLEQYTREYLDKKDVLEKLNAGASEESLSEEEKLMLKFETLPNYYTYKLCGVVLHVGTADSGHYISIAVDRESKEASQWYEFNDSVVSKFNPDLMQAEAFGMNEKLSRNKCGYMLIYERTTYFHMPTIRGLLDKLFEVKDPTKIKADFEDAQIDYNSLLTVKVSEDVEKRIVSENAKYRQTKVLLNPDYLTFINKFMSLNKPLPNENLDLFKKLDLQRVPFTVEDCKEEEKSLDELQFFAIFVFTAMFRTTLRSDYYVFLKKLRQAISCYLSFSAWLLESFTNPYIINEFLIACPISKVRFITASLLIGAFDKVYKYEERRIQKYIKNPKLFAEKLEKLAEVKPFEEATKTEAYFINGPKKGLPYCLMFLHNLMTFVVRFTTNRRAMFEYFFLLSSLCKQWPILLSFLFEHGMLGVVLEISLELMGAESENMKKHKFIVLGKTLSLGFQKHDVEKITDLNKRMFTNSVMRNKHYRFLIELLSQMVIACTKKAEEKAQEEQKNVAVEKVEANVENKVPESEIKNDPVIAKDDKSNLNEEKTELVEKQKSTSEEDSSKNETKECIKEANTGITYYEIANSEDTKVATKEQNVIIFEIGDEKQVKTNEKTKPLAITIDYNPTDSELTLIRLLTIHDNVNKVLICGDNNVARKSIVDLVVHLSVDNKDSKEYLETLMVKSAQLTCKELPLYVMLIEALVNIKDSLTEDRVLSFVSHLLCLTKNRINESYIAYCYFTDLFIKLALNIESIHRQLQEDPKKFVGIEKWLKSNKYPEPNSIYWEKTNLKSVPIRADLTTKEKELCKSYTKKKLEVLSLLKQVSTPKKPAPDISKIEFPTEELKSSRDMNISESKRFNIM